MTPLVLLPGMMCDERLFGRRSRPSRRHHPAAPPSPATPAWPALAPRTPRPAPPRFALLGLSMGGIVAMEILRHRPRPRRAPRPARHQPLAETPAVQPARTRPPWPASNRRPRRRHARRDDARLPPRRRRRDFVASAAPWASTSARTPSAPVARPRLPRRPADTLAGYRGPALVLTGADDTLCPRDRHDRMHALMPRSRLAVIDDAGHLPTLEQPEPPPPRSPDGSPTSPDDDLLTLLRGVDTPRSATPSRSSRAARLRRLHPRHRGRLPPGAPRHGRLRRHREARGRAPPAEPPTSSAPAAWPTTG